MEITSIHRPAATALPGLGVISCLHWPGLFNLTDSRWKKWLNMGLMMTYNLQETRSLKMQVVAICM
jgi:hypothetical protein